jgi:hypothetical protein
MPQVDPLDLVETIREGLLVLESGNKGTIVSLTLPSREAP